MRHRHSLIPVLTLLFFTQALAQDYKLKWGKVPDEHIEMTSYDPDPQADAVVLANVLKVYFEFVDEESVFVYNRHHRIKLLNESAFEHADIRIPYIDYGTMEEFLEFKANLFLPNGKRIKIDKENIHFVKTDIYHSEARIDFPKLEPGAVIEYKFSLRSFITDYIKPFYFESDVPTLFSEFYLEYPDQRYEFHRFLSQSFDYDELQTSLFQKNFKVRPEDTSFGLTGNWNDGSNRNTTTLELLMENHYISVSDVPAHIVKSPGASEYDQWAHVSFQSDLVLGVRKWKRWWDLAQHVSSLDFFGGQYRKKSNALDLLGDRAETWSKSRDPESLIPKVYDLVREKISWDGSFGWVPSPLPDEAISQKSGNGAAVNLAMISALRYLGLDAWPVFISTREHGSMENKYPYLEQFNHVFCYVSADGKEWLLDLTGGLHPMDKLPDHSQNEEAWLAHSTDQRWLKVD